MSPYGIFSGGSSFQSAGPDSGTPPVPPSTEGGWNRIPIRTTGPDELRRHNISDEELDMLGDNRRGFFHEFMWATLTGALGTVPAAGHDINAAFFTYNAPPLTGFELFEIVLFFVFAVLAGFSAVMVRQEGKHDPDSLKEKIRARTRIAEG